MSGKMNINELTIKEERKKLRERLEKEKGERENKT
jgi:hypothetical protein